MHTQNNRDKSRYLILDGLDLCGKGTQLVRLAGHITAKDKRYDHLLLTREPSYGPFGRLVRSILEEETDPIKSAKECSENFFQDRLENTIKHVIPALNQGYIVLQDRGKYSTVAYQGAQGINVEEIVQRHNEEPIMQQAKPDLIIILDVTPREALRRLHVRGAKKEKFEDSEFLGIVRNHFLKMNSYFPNEDIQIINGILTIDQVAQEIQRRVDQILPH